MYLSRIEGSPPKVEPMAEPFEEKGVAFEGHLRKRNLKIRRDRKEIIHHESVRVINDGSRSQRSKKPGNTAFVSLVKWI